MTEPLDLPSRRDLAAVVHRLDYRTLHQLVPQADQTAVGDIRRDFVSFVLSSRTQFATWQAAWNGYVGLRGRQPSVQWTPAHCPECRGRRYSMKAMARSGNMICPACRGNGRGQLTILPARLAPDAD